MGRGRSGEHGIMLAGVLRMEYFAVGTAGGGVRKVEMRPVCPTSLSDQFSAVGSMSYEESGQTWNETPSSIYMCNGHR